MPVKLTTKDAVIKIFQQFLESKGDKRKLVNSETLSDRIIFTFEDGSECEQPISEFHEYLDTIKEFLAKNHRDQAKIKHLVNDLLTDQ